MANRKRTISLERQKRAIELHKEGWSLSQIAEACNINKKTVTQIIENGPREIESHGRCPDCGFKVELPCRACALKVVPC